MKLYQLRIDTGDEYGLIQTDAPQHRVEINWKLAWDQYEQNDPLDAVLQWLRNDGYSAERVMVEDIYL